MSHEPPSNRKRLTRGHDRKLGGVASGLADYFETDPTLIRVLFVVALFMPPIGGAAFIAYLAMWLIVPAPEGDPPPRQAASDAGESRGGTEPAVLLGIVIIAVGAMMLMRSTWVWMPWFGWGGFQLFWPLALIGLGAFILLSGRNRGS